MIRGRAIDCASAAVETAATMTGNSTLNFMCALSLGIQLPLLLR
jgi:hypothetical protein